MISQASNSPGFWIADRHQVILNSGFQFGILISGFYFGILFQDLAPVQDFLFRDFLELYEGELRGFANFGVHLILLFAK